MPAGRWCDDIYNQMSKPEVCLHAPEPRDILAFAARNNFHPDEIQQQILTSSALRIVLLMGRQTGKTTTVACKAVHLAVTQPGARIVTAGRVGRQSCELLKRSAFFLRDTPCKIRKNEIEFENGSSMIALPGSVAHNVRGLSAINLLIVDEAAFAAEDLFVALRPMCATVNGATILLSTPNGRNGFFYRAWSSGQWERYFQPTTHCARISPEFLAREKESMTDLQYRQEYLCEFTDPAGSMFSMALLEEAIDPEVLARNL